MERRKYPARLGFQLPGSKHLCNKAGRAPNPEPVLSIHSLYIHTLEIFSTNASYLSVTSPSPLIYPTCACSLTLHTDPPAEFANSTQYNDLEAQKSSRAPSVASDGTGSTGSSGYNRKAARMMGGNSRWARFILRIPILWRAIIIISLPMLALICLTSINVAEQSKRVKLAKELEREVLASDVILNTIGALQIERARATEHFGCLLTNTKAACEKIHEHMVEDRAATDVQVALLIDLTRGYDGLALNDQHYVDTYRQILGIESHRDLIDDGTHQSEAALAWYTSAIEGLLITVTRVRLVIHDDVVAPLHASLVELDNLREKTGVAIGLGSSLYVAGRHADRESYKSWVYDIYSIRSQAKAFKEGAPDVVLKLWEEYEPDDTLFNVKVDELMTYDHTSVAVPSLAKADAWFDLLHDRMTRMSEMTHRIVEVMSARARKVSADATRDEIVLIVVVLAFIVFCCLLTYLLVISVNATTNVLKGEVKKRKEMTKAITRFFPSEFMALLGKGAVTEVQSGMQSKVNVAVMFIDIRNFTAICEGLSLEESFELLHEYARFIAPIIKGHHGFIDKMMGDGIMAVFETAPDAVRAAIKVQYELTCINNQTSCSLLKTGWPMLRVGIGIHCGDVVLGTLGDEKRIDGTIVGDAVNTASRLEGMTKFFGVNIIISGEVLEAWEDSNNANLSHRRLGTVRVKGKTTPIELYDVYQSDSIDVKKFKDLTRTDFEHACELYEEGRFKEAEETLNRLEAMYPVLTDCSVERRRFLTEERINAKETLMTRMASQKQLVVDFEGEHGPLESVPNESLSELTTTLAEKDSERAEILKRITSFDGIDDLTTKG
eukprot:TRINITY_DN819_c0_g1_i2.p1 TRINITY_DN819_c0_g1~~TRINITY_DN819_c0_g1_i2.p1  ORF type:complete len:835 (+),score=140.11 TRINITY_DN819_c0_g1_i2:576-3080(+)